MKSENCYKKSAGGQKVNYLIQNEIELIITTFLQENEPLTRARAILQQIATPNAELPNINAGSLNQRIAKSKKILNYQQTTLSKIIISLKYVGYY